MIKRAICLALSLAVIACGQPSTQPAAVAPTPTAPVAEPEGDAPAGPTRSGPQPPPDEALEQARALLGEIARAARAAFHREDLGPKGKALTGKLCPSSQLVPASLTSLLPTYHSTEEDWLNDPGWRCLKLSMEEPLHCQFRYESDASGFTATARCPGSGVLRELRLRGSVSGQDVKVMDSIEETDVPL